MPASCSNTGTARNTPGALAANGILGIGVFDWGLPFFYDRNVYATIEQQRTPGGVGPYFATEAATIRPAHASRNAGAVRISFRALQATPGAAPWPGAAVPLPSRRSMHRAAAKPAA